MGLISRSKVATGVYIVAGIIGGALGLGIIGLFVWLLVLWANAHFFSFALVLGIVVVVGLAIGLINALDWAAGVKAAEKADEQRAQFEAQEAKKMAAYKEKWGEDAKPIPNPQHNTHYFDRPPRVNDPASFAARRETIG